ncbi:hypothetical protein PR048_028508 [Dryococelus australis]|uniref:Uncharacterized protein n=1 Tax=Dryococelus australis TaxID=614101 RepID=A0ABQ9GDE2_9NEOP|nr:hypothetical protein PR048_028508 [Dryococelus australis]
MVINFSSSVKNLGIVIDETLSWVAHTTHICKKVYKTLHSIKRFKNLLPERIKILLVHALVLSIIEYCDVVYNDLAYHLNKRLQRLQNTYVGFVSNLKSRDHLIRLGIRIAWTRTYAMRVLAIFFFFLRRWCGVCCHAAVTRAVSRPRQVSTCSELPTHEEFTLTQLYLAHRFTTRLLEGLDTNTALDMTPASRTNTFPTAIIGGCRRRLFLTACRLFARDHCEPHSQVQRTRSMPQQHIRQVFAKLDEFAGGHEFALPEAGWTFRRIGRHLNHSAYTVARLCWTQ